MNNSTVVRIFFFTKLSIVYTSYSTSCKVKYGPFKTINKKKFELPKKFLFLILYIIIIYLRVKKEQKIVRKAKTRIYLSIRQPFPEICLQINGYLLFEYQNDVDQIEFSVSIEEKSFENLFFEIILDCTRLCLNKISSIGITLT